MQMSKSDQKKKKKRKRKRKSSLGHSSRSQGFQFRVKDLSLLTVLKEPVHNFPDAKRQRQLSLFCFRSLFVPLGVLSISVVIMIFEIFNDSHQIFTLIKTNMILWKEFRVWKETDWFKILPLSLKFLSLHSLLYKTIALTCTLKCLGREISLSV